SAVTASWSTWLEMWSTWARLSLFRRRVEWAKVAVRSAGKRRLYASLSGGKDSVAMVGLIHEAGIDVHCAHAHSDLNLPESLSIVDAMCERLNLSYDIVEPERDPWQMMAEFPPGIDVSAFRWRDALARECSAGNLLVQYCYTPHAWGLPADAEPQSWDGAFVGLRSDESNGRLANRKVRGSLYQSAIDETWTCTPIVDWSARDVFAFIVSRNLPIHPFYRRACEEMNLDPEKQRIDWLFGTEMMNALGALVPIRKLYPNHWRRLILVRPELAQYAP